MLWGLQKRKALAFSSWLWNQSHQEILRLILYWGMKARVWWEDSLHPLLFIQGWDKASRAYIYHVVSHWGNAVVLNSGCTTGSFEKHWYWGYSHRNSNSVGLRAIGTSISLSLPGNANVQPELTVTGRVKNSPSGITRRGGRTPRPPLAARRQRSYLPALSFTSLVCQKSIVTPNLWVTGRTGWDKAVKSHRSAWHTVGTP